MARVVVRIVLGLLGSALVLIGVGAAAAGGWITATLGSQDSLRSTPQVIDVPGCSTVLMEIADAQVDIDQLEALGDLDPLAGRTDALLTIGVAGDAAAPWLVGIADQQEVEGRLLGARYCVVEVNDGAWSFSSIAVEPDAPDVNFSGLPGLWAKAGNGESVAVPLPTAGESLVVSGSSGSALSTIEIAGEYRIQGASDVGMIALIAGVITVVLGVGALIVSIAVLRNRGQHEGRHRESSA